MELLEWIRASPVDPHGSRWDWNKISRNKAVTVELIQDHPDLPWDFRGLQLNPNLTLAYVLAHPEMEWDYDRVIEKVRYDLDELLASGIKNSYRKASWNPHINLTDLEKYPDIPWSVSGITFNPHMTIGYLLQHRDKFTKLDHWRQLSRNRGLTLSNMLAHPELPWYWDEISDNKSITKDDLENHPDIPWHYTRLSANPNISLDYILAHPEKPWHNYWLSMNEGLTLQQVLRCPSIEWDYNAVCQHVYRCSYIDHLGLITREQRNPASYWSRLPRDMLVYYLARYFPR